MKRKRYLWLLILTIFCIVSAFMLYASMPKFIGSFENMINDSMFLYRGEIQSDDRIIIVDIDEKSLRELGQWPWSRNVLAKILDNLTDANVAAIGLDMIFAEEDKSSPIKVLRDLNLSVEQKLLDYDEIFANSIKNSPTITGFFFSMQNDKVKSHKEPRTRARIVEKNKPKKSYLPNAYRAILSIDKINDSAYSNGFINYSAKFDKVARNVPSIIVFDDILYPSLSIELTRLALGSKSIVVNYNENGVENLIINDTIIPTDIYGNMTINYTGYHPAYPYVSAIDIYKNDFKKEYFEGKIILLGTSAAGLFDIRSSPFDAVMPGVEAHANLIDNILNQNFISKPQWTMSVDVLILALLPILCFFVLLDSRIYISILAGIFFILSLLVGHYVLMFDYGIIFHTTILLFEIIFMYFVGNIVNYFYEHRQKEFIKTKFANKVSQEVMEDIVNDSDNLLKGDMKEISIFFSDIRGFTTISESMHSPMKLIEFLNSYMTPMTDIIIKNKGTVDKFIGDAIMAYWNAPRKLENHADYAMKSAIEQIEELKKLNEKLKSQNSPLINIGIGLNTGKCIVGEMGSQGRSDYTCIGDSVNLASRLEGLNKKYNTNIIISEFFLAKLSNPDIYDIEELGNEKVKGKNESVKIFTCKGYK